MLSPSSLCPRGVRSEAGGGKGVFFWSMRVEAYQWRPSGEELLGTPTYQL